jgi:hypothetical protein
MAGFQYRTMATKKKSKTPKTSNTSGVVTSGGETCDTPKTKAKTKTKRTGGNTETPSTAEVSKDTVVDDAEVSNSLKRKRSVSFE